MSANCMNQTLTTYLQTQLPASCPSSPEAASYECLCNSTTFTSWYMATLCINCNGTSLQNPLSDLTSLCPDFAVTIQSDYPDSCNPYTKELSPLPTATRGSGSNSIPTMTSPSSRSSSSSLSTSAKSTVVLRLTTPSPYPSSLSSSIPVSIVTASPLPFTHSFLTASSNSATFPASSTSSPNLTYYNTPTPTPLTISSASSSGMSTGAKAGIGVGAAAAAIGIAFIFMALLTLLRRRRSLKSGSDRRSPNYTGHGMGGAETSTTIAEIYRDDDSQYHGFGGSDRYGSNGLGIAGIGGRNGREKMGLVPSGRIREVRVSEDRERRSGFAAPLRAEGVSESNGEGEGTSSYPEDEIFGMTREGNQDEVRHSAAQEQGRWSRPFAQDNEQWDPSLRFSRAGSNPHDAEMLRFSTAQASAHEQSQAGSRYSTAQESNYETAMRPKSRIYSVVDSPVLNLGQEDLSREELERLEEEERRIDEAIRESESRIHLGTESGSIGKAL